MTVQLTEPRLFEGALRRHRQVGKLYRLRQKVFGAASHRLDGERDIAMRGHHDDDALLRLEALEQIESLDIGKLEVEQHEVGVHAKARVEPVVASVRTDDLMTHALEEGAEGGGELDLIVDDGDRGHATAAPPNRGAPRHLPVRTAFRCTAGRFARGTYAPPRCPRRRWRTPRAKRAPGRSPGAPRTAHRR